MADVDAAGDGTAGDRTPDEAAGGTGSAEGPGTGALRGGGSARPQPAATVAATACIWFARPDPAWTLWALACVGLGTLFFELATVFYNAMLPELAPPDRIGRLSEVDMLRVNRAMVVFLGMASGK